MKTHLSPNSQKKQLGYALRPYKLWDEWVKSSVRPFTKRELTLIEIYRETNSYAICSERLHISMIEAANDIIAIIMRLKFQLPDYKAWEKEQMSLFSIVSGLGVQSLNELRVITFADLKRHLKIAEKPINRQKRPYIPP